MAQGTRTICAYCGEEQHNYKANLLQRTVRGALVWLHDRCVYPYIWLNFP